MKTIFNWTIGSFFRSIGRIFAYITIGCIIAYLLNISGFDWGRLIGIEYVKADTQVNGRYMNYYSDSSRQNEYTYTNDYAKATVTNNGSNITNLDIYFGQNISVQNNENYILIPIMLLGETYNNHISTVYQCDDWSNYNDSTGNGYYCKSFVDSNSNIYSYTNTQFKMNVILRATVGHNGTCTIQGNMAKCFLEQGATYQGIRIQYNYSLSNFTTMYLGVYRALYSYYDSTNAINDSINQQTQQQQQQYNDTNTTQESNDSSNYILNQQDDTPSGLTSAITSPLRIIDNAISGTKNPLCFTLNGKQACIPSGDIIWGGNTASNNYHHWFDSGYFNPKQTFISFFNIVVAGYLCYKMLLSMMRIFNSALDPTITRIEVMKL